MITYQLRRRHAHALCELELLDALQDGGTEENNVNFSNCKLVLIGAPLDAQCG
jgi:hypothetical protein